jgi:hypothetical protein
MLDARSVMRSKSYTEDAQILGTIIQNLVAQMIWHTGFVHPWYIKEEKE